jgi:hypothetical protein
MNLIPEKRAIFLFIFFLLGSQSVYCLTDNARVSVLTYEPGYELYTIFGHSAIRIYDESLHIDRIYNFGTFDFSSPFFYVRFVRGNLDYFLSVYDFNILMDQSFSEKRKIHEQLLKMSSKEKSRLFIELERCYRSTDRFYKYDFFYDNCATRIRDVVYNSMDTLPVYDSTSFCCKTFRQLIEPYIDHNYYLNLGINLVLGHEADKIASSSSFMFLPDYIFAILQKTDKVEIESILIDYSEKPPTGFFCRMLQLSPLLIFVLLIGMTLYRGTRKAITIVFLFTIGLIGIFLLLISTISLNPAFAQNSNVCWTLPALAVVLIPKGSINRIIQLLYIILLLLFIILKSYFFQEVAPVLIPWMLYILSVLSINLWVEYRIRGARS